MKKLLCFGFCLSILFEARLAAEPRIVLTRSKTEDHSRNECPVLSRELLRQSVLIAARRELKCDIADEVLGEPAHSPDDLILDPELTSNSQARQCSFSVWKHDAAAPLFSTSLNVAVWERMPQDGFVEAEKLSRTVFVDLLRSAASTQPVDATAALHAGNDRQLFNDSSGEVDPAALAALDRVDSLQQLSAVRCIDQQIFNSGESAPRLAALARGYANLWQLTEFIWGGAAKDFAARALLYGQRAVIEYPSSVDAAEALAYAEAMVGLPKLSLDQFEKAKSMRAAAMQGIATQSVATQPAATPAAASPPAASSTAAGQASAPLAVHAAPPYWAALAIDLSNYDVGELTNAATADPGHAPWATLLAFLTVEHMPSQTAPIRFAQAALNKSPNCVRLLAAITDRAGPGIGNDTSVAAFDAFARSLADAVALPDLPVDVAQTIKAYRAADGRFTERRAITSALNAAGENDHAEPSWNAVARLVDDSTFMTIVERSFHAAHRLGIDPAPMIDEALPLLEHHRYLPYLDALRQSRQNPRGFIKQLATVKIDDPSFAMYLVLDPWQKLRNAATQVSILDFARTGDGTAFDTEASAQILMQVPQLMAMIGGPLIADRLRPVAPDSPTVMAADIYARWQIAEPHVQQWLDATGDHPTLTLALANHYRMSGDQVRAAEMYQKYLALSPDPDVYKDLAEMYRLSGDEKKWLATVDECLKFDSPGLENARLAQSVAEHFLTAGQPQLALPYAQNAAGSASAWAEFTLAETYEALGQFDQAEKTLIDSGQQYNNASLWLEFCVRTGHGDKAAAQAQLRDAVSSIGRNSDREARTDLIAYDVLIGDNANAEKAAVEVAQDINDSWSGMIAWSLATQRKDSAVAKQMLDLVINGAANDQFGNGQGRPDLVQAAHDLKDAIDKGMTDPTMHEPHPRGEEIDDGSNVCYFAGQYCESCGNLPAAIRFYRQGLLHWQNKLARTLCVVRVRALTAQSTTMPASTKSSTAD